MRLGEHTWTEADEVETDLALVPIGSTEQHGPHAPLSTDTLNAVAIAEAGAEAYGEPVVIAPTVPFGVSEEHRHFTGTVWVAPDTLRACIRDLAASLASHGWRRIVLVNGHGGNSDALREIAARLTRDGEAGVYVFSWFDAIGDRRPEMGHGGPLETAMLHRHHPELVRTDRVDDAAAGASEGWGEWVSRTNLAYDSAEFTDNGVVGDPSEANAELGEELTERAGHALSELLGAVAKRDVERPRHK